jgi:hypothetical protein
MLDIRSRGNVSSFCRNLARALVTAVCRNVGNKTDDVPPCARACESMSQVTNGLFCRHGYCTSLFPRSWRGFYQDLTRLLGLVGPLAVRLLLLRSCARQTPQAQAESIAPALWLRVLELFTDRPLGSLDSAHPRDAHVGLHHPQ